MRAAVYARMSTDKQSEDSPADQIVRCCDFAKQKGWHVVEALVAVDAGVSGASRHNRPELLRLLSRVADFDVLLCWDFSRLARDGEDQGWIRNRLRVAKKTAVEVSTGLDLFNVGSKVMGVFAEEYLVKLSADTHRGMRGRVERGFAAGGAPYGYRLEKPDPDAPSTYVVVQHAAAVVRRIFEDYVRGASLRELAHGLNRDQVPPPRPRALRNLRPSWSVTALREMLLNPIYKGELVWNRSQWIKDHETGKRRRFKRPESEWIRRSDPGLAILPAGLWEAARAAMSERGTAYTRRADGRIVTHSARTARGRHLLSGFLECGSCGGAFHALNSTATYGCGWHQKRGPAVCEVGLRVPRLALEARFLEAVRERVLDPELVLFVVERTLERTAEIVASRDPVADRRRLAEVEAELANLARFAAKTGRVDEAAELYGELDRERRGLLARSLDRPTAFDRETLAAKVEARVRELRSGLDGAPDHGRAILRALLGSDRIRVSPDEERDFQLEGTLWLEVETETARQREADGRFHEVVAGESNAREYLAAA